MTYDPQLVPLIRRTATNLGINPSDLATAISYETGGTMNHNLWGGAGGKYLGAIQFGPEEQKKYGVTPGMPLDAHFSAIENFLRDRGIKPGMGMLDLYSTINAGSPGRYNASDASNGGAPGTVADKVAEQMYGHRLRANAMLGGEAPPAVAQPAAPAAGTGGAPVSTPTPTDAQPATADTSQAGSLDLGKLAAGLQGMGKAMGNQQQNNNLDPVQISAPMPSGLPSAQRLAAVMASLGR